MSENPNSSRPHDLIDAISAVCEKDGVVREVGPEFYQAFASLTDDEIAEMIFDLMRHQRDFIKGREGDPVANAVTFTTAMLTLVASGNVAFDDYGRMTFFKPLGREPTLEMWEPMDARIDRAKPLMHAIAQKLFAPKR